MSVAGWLICRRQPSTAVYSVELRMITWSCESKHVVDVRTDWTATPALYATCSTLCSNSQLQFTNCLLISRLLTLHFLCTLPPFLHPHNKNGKLSLVTQCCKWDRWRAGRKLLRVMYE